MFNLKARLQKTRDGFVSPLKRVFQRGVRLSLEDQDAVEELLIGSDMGVEACDRIMDALKSQRETSDYQEFLRNEFLGLLIQDGGETSGSTITPRAIIVTGVNGVGKTTSIAKLANFYKTNGKQVILAAGDTFRAAAQDQLALWAERLDIELIGHRQGGDPAAVAFDACTAAKSRNVDYVIVDTAGRLHTRVNLMEELKKIHRVCEKVLGPDAVDAYLTLDATLGQNSLHQAKEFTKGVPTRGIILTKIDSTAKGGIVIAIRQALGIPVSFIGAGEGVDDFAPFDPAEFVDALLSS